LIELFVQGGGYAAVLFALNVVYRKLNENDTRVERKVDRINGQILDHEGRIAHLEGTHDAEVH
jgi:hypothetical protein